MRTPSTRLLAVFACLFVLAGCGGSDDAKTATTTTHTRAGSATATSTTTTTAPGSTATSTTTSSPPSTPQTDAATRTPSALDQRQALDVSRDFQDAAIAHNCDLCDPYTIYTWLVQNRGYPTLTKSEFDRRTLEVCSMPAEQRNRDRVNIALFLLDAGSDKKQVCPSAFD